MKSHTAANYYMYKYICFMVDWIKLYGFDTEKFTPIMCLDKMMNMNETFSYK